MHTGVARVRPVREGEGRGGERGGESPPEPEKESLGRGRRGRGLGGRGGVDCGGVSQPGQAGGR